MPDTRSIKNALTLSDPQNNSDSVYKPDISVESENKDVNRHMTYIKQSIKSRLTVCQIILLILNIVGIITFLAIVMSTKNPQNNGILFRNEILKNDNKVFVFFCRFYDD